MVGPGGRVTLLRGALAAARCAELIERIDTTAAALPAAHPDLQPTSASLRLVALGEAAFDDTLAELFAGPAGAMLRARLGDRAGCLRQQCWARRQHPPASRPPGQAAHAWHQDGALHARFDGSAEPLAGALVTLWLALVDCGDQAPSLQWVDADTPALLPPAALTDDAVAQRWGAGRRRHAVLEAGDALLFDGTLLHRTHATAAMSRRRVSVEWRFVAEPSALPARLAGEPLVRCPWTP